MTRAGYVRLALVILLGTVAAPPGRFDAHAMALPADSGLTLDTTVLNFGIGAYQIRAFRTYFPGPAQLVHLLRTGPADVAWTAATDRSWLSVSPTAGVGPAELTVSIILPLGGLVPVAGTGQVTIQVDGGSGPGPITVNAGLALGAIGGVDPSPAGPPVSGAVPITGWKLDGVGNFGQVMLCLEPVPGGSDAWATGACAKPGEVPLGQAVLTKDSRPEVLAAHPQYPAQDPGWGFLLQTALLPNGGNGTFLVHVYQVELFALGGFYRYNEIGTRTITCANGPATAPFGVVDTPSGSDLVAATMYPSFAWALTPQPGMIPGDGSTFRVAVDGVPAGPVTFGLPRPDVGAAFPGLANSAGAGAYSWLNTGALGPGQHSLVWVVSDDRGATAIVGERYFWVAPGAGPAPASGVRAAFDTDAFPLEAGPLTGRVGWAPGVPPRGFHSDALGRVMVAAEELQRIELALGPGHWTGYLRRASEVSAGAVAVLTALPAGATLDPSTGSFVWAPGVGFVGTYRLVFLRDDGGVPIARREIQVVLHRAGRAAAGPQVVIDTPRTQQDVGQPFLLAGWAADLDAPAGTGFATLHAWAYPLTGAAPVFLGATAYGGERPDVAAAYGDQFRNSGFGVVVQGLTPGNYDLAVFAWSWDIRDFLPARVVRVTVRP